jgi:hypothetical protein
MRCQLPAGRQACRTGPSAALPPASSRLGRPSPPAGRRACAVAARASGPKPKAQRHLLSALDDQNKEIVSVFNGSVVYFNVGIGLTFFGRCCSSRQELYFHLFLKSILAVKTVEILCPEVNMRSSHNTKAISIQI